MVKEPIRDKGPWKTEYTPDYRTALGVSSLDFTHNVYLDVSGDFETDDDKIEYCEWLTGVLNKNSRGE